MIVEAEPQFYGLGEGATDRLSGWISADERRASITDLALVLRAEGVR